MLSDVSFALGPGEALAVTGRNGAGKSTLLAAIAGLIRPEQGAVEASGLGDESLTARLHHLGHRDGLKTALSAAENLAFAADLLGEPRLPPAAALSEVGLAGAAALPVGYLSAGQRRRVTLARLLVAHRPLWLLDEPTTALDADGQAMLMRLVAAHRAGGGLVVAATHAPLPLPDLRELALGAHSPGPEPVSGSDAADL